MCVGVSKAGVFLFIIMANFWCHYDDFRAGVYHNILESWVIFAKSIDFPISGAHWFIVVEYLRVSCGPIMIDIKRGAKHSTTDGGAPNCCIFNVIWLIRLFGYFHLDNKAICCFGTILVYKNLPTQYTEVIKSFKKWKVFVCPAVSLVRSGHTGQPQLLDGSTWLSLAILPCHFSPPWTTFQ